MKKNLYSALVAVAGGVAMVSAPVQAETPDGLSFNYKFQQLVQDVDTDDGAANQETSFEFPRASIGINAQFTPWLSAYTEFTNENSDWAGGDRLGAEIQNDLTLINVSLLKAAGSAAAENNSLTLQFGTPVGGLSNYFNGSDGSLVQTNPLIGNAPFRAIDAHTGFKLIGSHDIGGVVKSVSWDAGLYTSNFFPQHNQPSGESLNLRGRVDFTGGFSGGLGYVDAEDNGAILGANNDTFNVNGSHSTSFDPGVSNGEGWSAQAQWKAPSGMMLEGSKILGEYFEIEPDTGAAGVEGEAFRLLGQAYVVPDTAYLAARYTAVENEDASNNDEGDRFQIGGGVWLADNTLLKAEYFDQSEEVNAASAAGGGADFDGFGLELSSTF